MMVKLFHRIQIVYLVISDIGNNTPSGIAAPVRPPVSRRLRRTPRSMRKTSCSRLPRSEASPTCRQAPPGSPRQFSQSVTKSIIKNTTRGATERASDGHKGEETASKNKDTNVPRACTIYRVQKTDVPQSDNFFRGSCPVAFSQQRQRR